MRLHGWVAAGLNGLLSRRAMLLCALFAGGAGLLLAAVGGGSDLSILHKLAGYAAFTAWKRRATEMLGSDPTVLAAFACAVLFAAIALAPRSGAGGRR